MNFKTITRIEHPTQHHMVGDGFRVSQYIPGYGREMGNDTSPFLMLDYNAPWQVPASGDHRPGVGFHPHRGFETVTIVYSGEVEHQDTAGNGGVIGYDEVQWMTAGSGLLHNEFMTESFSRFGGTQHAVQLWVNLPKKDKMTKPKYQALTRDSIPEVAFAAGKVRVISGNYAGTKGAASTFSPVELYDIRFDQDGSLPVKLVDGYNTMLLVVAGAGAKVGGEALQNGDMAYLTQNGDQIEITATAGTKLLLMAGEPLNEPVAAYGPFVMNTHAEIMQAFSDLKQGKMGLVPHDRF